MTDENKGKISLYEDHLDVYGNVDSDYVTDLAKKHLTKIKSKDSSSGSFSEKQELMMHALPKECRSIMKIIQQHYSEHNGDWPTQAKIRDELSVQIPNCGDVYCKRKIDELEKKEFVVYTKKTRGKKIILSQKFRDLK